MAELYAIVGDMPRARMMLAARVPYLQLRFKSRSLAPHRHEIASWPEGFPDTRLIVNDDVRFAAEVGAWGVHLGQEDLMRYAPAELAAAAVRVGISTHSDQEIARALDLRRDGVRPAYLGFGPVFATGTKVVGHAPQGVTRLAEIVRQVPLPVVAIGGIGPGNMADVAHTGTAAIAMIAALERCHSPGAVRRLMADLRAASPANAPGHRLPRRPARRPATRPGRR